MQTFLPYSDITESLRVLDNKRLDYILDKIAINGMDSLTQFEKDTLDTYSKI